MLAALAGLATGAETRDARHLDITIAVFDAGLPPDATNDVEKGVFPGIRDAETRLLPFELRETLVRSGEWGAVRVVPEEDTRAELLVTGTILQSDGVALSLAMRAADSTGRVWIDNTYTVAATRVTDDDTVQHYQALFDRVATDLVAARAPLTDKTLSTIQQASLLRYARELSAEVFSGFLEEAPDGTVSIRRLPAVGDPMFDRVQRIRQYEYVFIDTLDEQYREAYAEVARAYDLWRQYRRDLATYREAERTRLIERESDAPRGSYQAIKRSYDSFRWARMEEQSLARWAERFNNELAPTVMALDDRVFELSGGLDARYAEWRRILGALFEVETGGVGAVR